MNLDLSNYIKLMKTYTIFSSFFQEDKMRTSGCCFNTGRDNLLASLFSDFETNRVMTFWKKCRYVDYVKKLLE